MTKVEKIYALAALLTIYSIREKVWFTQCISRLVQTIELIQPANESSLFAILAQVRKNLIHPTRATMLCLSALCSSLTERSLIGF